MIVTALFLVLVVYGGFVLIVVLLQTKVIFPATRDVYRTPKSAYQWDYEDVRVPVSGQVTHAWFIHVENARGTVLFSHGNAGNVADRLESVMLFRDLQLDVLLYDYGGYGHSTGRPSEGRCYEDVRAMWRYLTDDRGIPPGQVVLFGRSLGGSMTAQIAAEVTPAAVILESTFLSTSRLAKEMLPWLPMKHLIRHRFDNAGKVTRFTSPLLVIHSPDDSLIPFRHGLELFRIAHEPKRFLEIHGDHNEGFVISHDLWSKTVDEFITPLLKKSAQ